MTRSEYIDDVTTWSEFIDAANEYGYEHDIYDSESYDESVEEDISDRDCSWNELRDYLNDLPSYDRWGYYRKEGWMEYYCLDEDDDLNSEKEDFIDFMDRHGLWEPEEEEETVPDEEEEAPVDDGFSIDMFGECNQKYVEIVSTKEEGPIHQAINTAMEGIDLSDIDFVF